MSRWRFVTLAVALLFVASCEGTPTSPSSANDSTDFGSDNNINQHVNIVIVPPTLPQNPPNPPNPPNPNPPPDTGGNLAPVLDLLTSQFNTVGTFANLTVRAYDPNGDFLIFSAFNLPRDLVMSSSGVVTGQLSSSSALESPFNVTVTVTDGLLSDSGSFLWTVTPAAGQ